jgi:hypothetical protein
MGEKPSPPPNPESLPRRLQAQRLLKNIVKFEGIERAQFQIPSSF